MLLGSHEVSGGGKPAPRGAAKAAEVVVALPAGLVTKCVEGVLRFGAQKSMSGTSLLTVRRPLPAPRAAQIALCSNVTQPYAISHVPQQTTDFGLKRGRPLAADSVLAVCSPHSAARADQWRLEQPVIPRSVARGRAAPEGAEHDHQGRQPQRPARGPSKGRPRPSRPNECPDNLKQGS